MSDDLSYMTGFGNEHATEALAGALPVGQNSPQRAPFGLYAELLSGTAFTAPRAMNRRTWFYRIRPSVQAMATMKELDIGKLRTAPTEDANVVTVPLRWDPIAIPDVETDFISGWHTMVTNGSSAMQQGTGIHLYVCNQSMRQRYFQNFDGELLIVPQLGVLRLRTEAGVLLVRPGVICVIPRGFKFSVELPEGSSRGYICENFGAHLQLPELGPIGSNSLANPRDFQYPTAAYDENESPCELITKTNGRLFTCEISHSPLNVVAWHGNYAPYKYDLSLFNTIGSVSFDHPDPSIYTVLTSQSDTAGTANLDFVVFPPRWLVAENTFRPPWYHRNIMSEYMGLIHGVYDAKPEGFVPGGSSLHNCMVPHGPDGEAFERGATNSLEPQKLDETMAFMFESRYPFMATDFAINGGSLQKDYLVCWTDIKRHFDPNQP